MGSVLTGCSDTEKSVASCNSDEVLTGGGVINSAGPVLYSKPVGNSWEAKGVSKAVKIVQLPKHMLSVRNCYHNDNKLINIIFF